MLARFLVLLLCSLALSAGTGLAAEQTVLVVVGDKTAAHDEAVLTLRREFERMPPGSATLRTVDSTDHEASRPAANVSAVVAVGTRAMQAVLAGEGQAPVLAMMVPRPAYEKTRGRAVGRRVSGVFIDQPVARQLALIVEALPEKRHVGVLIGPDSAYWNESLSAAARERGLQLTIDHVSAESDLFPSLQKVLAEARVLLAVPDTMVFNSSTIHNILLTAYRREVPLVGFSPAYTRAGALLSIYSTPEQMAVQAADMVRQALAGRGLPSPQYPHEFKISVNRQVARSLGLKVESEDFLERRLRMREVRE